MKEFSIPIFLLLLDGLGCVLVVLGLLGWLQVDIGLPVLVRIWPFLILLGLMLMAPMIVWVIKLARSRDQQ